MTKLQAFLTLSSFVVCGLAGVLVGADARAEDPAVEACTTTAFSSKKVEAACKSGGRAAAKSYMKEVVKTAKDKGGTELTCKSCHASLKDFALTADGKDQLAKIEKL